MAAKMGKGAWAKGPPNLNGQASKARAAPPTAEKTSDGPVIPKHNAVVARDRFLHTLVKFTGKAVVAKMADGAVYEGIWHVATTSTPAQEHQVAIRAARVTNGVAPDGFVAGSTLLVHWKDVLCVNCLSVDLRKDAPVGGSFSTDADISGGAPKHNDERALHAVDSSWVAAKVEGGLAAAPRGPWDQFEANERLYGVENTYDENLYTTALNKASLTPEQLREADRIARQIEGKSSSNPHLQEERGHEIQSNLTEEERFSGIIRNGSSSGAQGSWRKGVSGIKAKADVTPSKNDVTPTPPLAPVAPVASTVVPETGLAGANSAALQPSTSPEEGAPKTELPSDSNSSLDADAKTAAEQLGTELKEENTAPEEKVAKPEKEEEKKATPEKNEGGGEKVTSKLRATAKEWTPSFAFSGAQPAVPPATTPMRQAPMAPSPYAASPGQTMLPMRQMVPMMNMPMTPNPHVYMPYPGLVEPHQMYMTPTMAPMSQPQQAVPPNQQTPAPEPNLPTSSKNPPDDSTGDDSSEAKKSDHESDIKRQSPSQSPAMYNAAGMRGITPMMKGPQIMMQPSLHMLPQQQMRQLAPNARGYGNLNTSASMQAPMMQVGYSVPAYQYDPNMPPMPMQMSMPPMHPQGLSYNQPRPRGGGAGTAPAGRGMRKGSARGGGAGMGGVARPPRANGGGVSTTPQESPKPLAKDEGDSGAPAEVSGAASDATAAALDEAPSA